MAASAPSLTLAQAKASPPARPLWRSYALILVPMMLTNVLQAVSGTVDGIYLGQMIGVEAIAAVSGFFPVMFALLAIVIGLSSGATVLAGQAWGAHDVATARAVGGAVLCLLLCAGVGVAVGGAVAAPALMRVLGTPANVWVDAVLYARLMLLGMPVFFTLWFLTSLSRAVGDAVSPLLTLTLATVLSLVLTPAFIRGWWGLPALGVASAAVSTLIAFSLALVWTGWHWRRCGHPLAPSWALLADLRFHPLLLRKVVAIGAPTGLQMLAMALAELVLLGLVNRHGSNATAAYGAVSQIMGWLQFPALSLGIAGSILASHAIGAGRLRGLGAITRTGLWLNLAVTGSAVALAYALSPWLMRLFLADESVIALALSLLRLVAWTMVLRGASMVLGGVMRASGAVWVPTAIGAGAVAVIELPVAYGLNAMIGVHGIWWAYVATFITMLALQAAYYFGVWRHREVKRLV